MVIVILLLSVPAAAQDRAIWQEWGIKLEPFVPENPRAGVIVCPGGSYHWLDYETEGVKVAEWLATEGIAAFVLKYRVAGKFEFAAKYRTIVRGHRHPDMISDLQRAIQWFRCQYDLPLGVMGFSAGGHLVMSAGEFYDTDFNGDAGGVVLRPDFVVPVYPVVTLSDQRYVHKRSRLGLLGDAPAGNAGFALTGEARADGRSAGVPPELRGRPHRGLPQFRPAGFGPHGRRRAAPLRADADRRARLRGGPRQTEPGDVGLAGPFPAMAA